MKHIYIQNLKKHLKTMLKGKVTLHIEDVDRLVVVIHSAGCKDFYYNVDYITDTVVSGYPSEMLANSIVKCYRNYIFSKYFY